MFQKLTVSTLLVAGLFAMTTIAQPPAKPVQPPAEKAKPVDPVAAALANDPDVKIARAKVQLAEAEVAKAKQAVVLKVMTLNATIQEHKAAVARARDQVAHFAALVERGNAPRTLLLEQRAKLETAEAALARAETELKLLTGGGLKEVSLEGQSDVQAQQVASTLEWLTRSVERDQSSTAALALAALYAKGAVQGPIPDRIRAALDKTVKLGTKGESVPFEKALEVFKKEAGLDVPVRKGFQNQQTMSNGQPVVGPNLEVLPVRIEIVSEGEDLPVGAWFQLFEDQASMLVKGKPTKLRLYVREYGILLTQIDMAPTDAPTLTEFWKRKLDAAPTPAKPKN